MLFETDTFIIHLFYLTNICQTAIVLNLAGDNLKGLTKIVFMPFKVIRYIV